MALLTRARGVLHVADRGNWLPSRRRLKLIARAVVQPWRISGPKQKRGYGDGTNCFIKAFIGWLLRYGNTGSKWSNFNVFIYVQTNFFFEGVKHRPNVRRLEQQIDHYSLPQPPPSYHQPQRLNSRNECRTQQLTERGTASECQRATL